MKVIHYTYGIIVMEHFHYRILVHLFFHLMVLPSSDNNYFLLTNRNSIQEWKFGLRLATIGLENTTWNYHCVFYENL